MTSYTLLKSEIIHRTSSAAKMFLPFLLLLISSAVTVVLISLAHPVFIEISGYKFPIFMPYFEHATKIVCYAIIGIVFCSLFVSFTFRKHVLAIARDRAKSKAEYNARKYPEPSVKHAARNEPLSALEIRRRWELIRMERELSELDERRRKLNNQMNLDEEPLTDFEAFEILIPMLGGILLLLALVWHVVLVAGFIVVLVLGVRGTMNLVLNRMVDFVLRGAFRFRSF